MLRSRPLLAIVLLLFSLGLGGCAEAGEGPAGPPSPTTGPATEPAPGSTATDVARDGTAPSPTATSPRPVLATEPPVWLGTRVLPRGEDGFGTVVPTPPELRDRRIRTTDILPPPTDGFATTVETVPADVADRSTWSEECPVGLEELRYVTVSHWGFDEAAHTGELLIHRDAVDALTAVFQAAWDARFPIEEMRIVAPAELEAPPTGDGNNTTAFVCRPVRGSQRWSEHAYGLAIDVNPFHNPYRKGELVLPELASAYTDRTWQRPGMLQPGGPVVEAFRDVGWEWGGEWNQPIDWMHFSRDGG